MLKSYKWHPQPSSIRKSQEAAIKANFRDQIILDCFCGTGSHCIAALNSGAKGFIGSDIEDFSFCLRRDIARYNCNYQYFGDRAICFYWRLDAREAINLFNYDVLFIDPPNPYKIVGAATISGLRDTGLNGNQLSKFWKEQLSLQNLINKREKTLFFVKSVISEALDENKRVIVNLFRLNSNNFDYSDVFKDNFRIYPLFESYSEVFLK